MSSLKTKEEKLGLRENYDPDLLEGEVELLIPEGFGKDLKKQVKSIKNASRQEIKCLVDNYYQIQKKRIALQGQIRALKQDTDDVNTDAFCEILDWQLKAQMVQEKGLKDALDCICKTSEVGRWLLEVKGIGPTLAAGLMAYLDVTGLEYATHFISYAGLNDQNRPGLSSEASKKVVEDVLQGSKEITNDHLVELAVRTKWSYTYLDENCSKYDDEGNLKSRSKTDLAKAISKIPYNKNLKTLMFKIEESFIKVQNRGSLYGRLIQERKALETKLNEEGHYKEQAEKILASKNFGKDTDAYKAYSQGKLPKAHIQRRAARWAAKIFLVHVFEEMYRVENGRIPEPFYVFTYLGHKDVIGPEVEFTKVEGE